MILASSLILYASPKQAPFYFGQKFRPFFQAIALKNVFEFLAAAVSLKIMMHKFERLNGTLLAIVIYPKNYNYIEHSY